MSDKQNDRSDAAMCERLELAEKAVPKGEKTIWTADFASPHETCVRDAFTERILTMEDYTDQATAAHIAANHPDVVRADIEEILRLRQEVARLNKEADWLAKIMFFYTEECPLKMKIQDELPIPKLDECLGAWPENDYFDCVKNTPKKCWREAARKAVEEEERHG